MNRSWANPTWRRRTSAGSGEWAVAEHGSEFLFVEGYPMAKRPFYTHPEPGRPEFSNSFDLLFRGLELVTGGQRLHRYRDYESVVDSATREALDGYLEAFRHGMPPHGGFAIGLERWTARRRRRAERPSGDLVPPRHQPAHADQDELERAEPDRSVRSPRPRWCSPRRTAACQERRAAGAPPLVRPFARPDARDPCSGA